jgi:hypothetical protein
MWQQRVGTSIHATFEKFTEFFASHYFSASLGICRPTVRFLVSTQKFSMMIKEVLEAQKKYPGISTEGIAILLISLYQKMGMLDRAHKVIEERT